MFALRQRQRLRSTQLRYIHQRTLTLPYTNNDRPRIRTPFTAPHPNISDSHTHTHFHSYSQINSHTLVAYNFNTTAPKTTHSTNSRATLLLRHLDHNANPSRPGIGALQSRTASAMAHSKATQPFAARKIGAPNTLDYRIFIEKDGVPLSPFHDIPLYANDQQTVLIVEVPRWTNAKMEVNTFYFF